MRVALLVVVVGGGGGGAAIRQVSFKPCMPAAGTIYRLQVRFYFSFSSLFSAILLIISYVPVASGGFRVLARISKMPVQKNNFKNFARPDLATYLLQILYQLHLIA